MSSFSIDYGQVSDMSDSSSENEAKKTPGSQKGSSSGDSTPGDNTSSPLLKKGPWTNAEDAILVEYVRKHGEGNWNAVQKHSGLSRCGKSCRLRWANHLRPDLKKGAFNEEEESLIVELHAKMGNKWARMAAELPGRTDNEIKNYWNTRLKRMQRAGLPLYPPECLEAMKNEGHLGEDAGSGSPAGEKNLYETSQGKEYDIPEFNKFKRLSPPLLDLRSSCIVNNNMSISQNFGFMLSAPPQKRLREIDTPPFPISSLTANGGGFSSFNQNHYDPYSAKPFWPSSYDPGSHGHALINGNNNNSTSEPISATMKLELELPSLQTDTLIQTDCPSPRSSGLLEAIVYESQSLKNSKDHLQISDASTSDSLLETSSQNVDETKWDSIRDAISPLSHSVASVFIDHNNGSSSEQPQSAESVQGFNCTQEAADMFPAEYFDDKIDCSNHLEYDSFWVGNRTLLSKEQSITADIDAIFGDDMNTEFE